MRLIFRKGLVAVVSLCFVFSLNAQAPKKTPKYNSLLWEITGNGLKKPSYLFGTMHVSSKMVFHLSDSFYHAIQGTDMVALELNPQTWQPEMFRMQDAEQDLGSYFKSQGSGYINEKSFALQRYEDNIKLALSEEPTVVNGLLYRTYQPQADFEENTYLDLYVYQTGRKLGKKGGGVEDYWESQKIIMEGYKDMAIERAKKKNNYNDYDTDENPYEVQKKVQEAYRNGDLDMLDSLEKKMETSPAFSEKFLYKRNEVQANSIDSILKRNSLFVAVGAAHLPGERGVIELLRKMGYKLRPVKIQNRDAAQKDKIDKLRVPVKFSQVNTPDAFVRMMMPGPLFKRDDLSVNPSWQYADMENGAYYMLTRVATHAAMLGEDEKTVLKKVDSLLYENIPGKIISKKDIERNGYKGYDITNKTRRGDIQRYNIFVTPFEVLVFKMSGNDDYVTAGKEANDFFSSITLKENTSKPVVYEPSFGGFKMNLPQEPVSFLRKTPDDRLNTWQFEAVDKSNGNGFMVWKKSIYSFGFLEEDTFDLSLVEESLRSSEIIDKLVKRSFTKVNGYPALDMEFLLKSGSTLNAKAVIKGPHYYLVATTAKKKNGNRDLLNSFTITDFRYGKPVAFTDTFYQFKVNTSFRPVLDTALRNIYEASATEAFLDQTEYYRYGAKDRYATFFNDTTGEMVLVTMQKFPKYYYSRDTARFFKNEYNTEKLQREMILVSKEKIRPGATSFGYKYVFLDTNSSRKLTYVGILQNNKLFKIASVTDTTSKGADLITQFISSFVPESKDTTSLFRSKLDQFFADLNSKDSLTRKRSMDAASQLYFGPQAIPRLKKVIDSLKWGDKDYFELKSRFINELGYLDDSCCVDDVISYLNNLYERTADTAIFQNAIIMSLARLKTKHAFASLKEHLMQDPPVFESSYDLKRVFGNMEDTLALSRIFFPDILQLMTIDDYKSQVTSLLRTMVDSGYLKAADYDKYFSNIYFDAKIELKRQQSADVRKAEKETNKDQEGDGDSRRTYNGDKSDVDNYAVLLMPFYEKNATIKKFFDKLLQSKNMDVRKNTAVLMLRNNIPVADSILLSVAATDQFRASLLRDLELAGKESYFPAAYKKQEDIARSLLLEEKEYEKFADIRLVGRKQVQVKNHSGFVYFFKYKLKKEDDWKIGISGIQPDSANKVNTNDLLVSMTDKKLNPDTPEAEQFEKQLKRLMFSLRRSSSNFYRDNNSYGNFRYGNGDGDGEDEGD
jgi:uncharacterized protein YbaP (TraB family)